MSVLEWAKSFFGGIGAALSAILGAIGRFFNSLFQAELNIQDNLIRIRDNFESGKADIQSGIKKIKAFKFEPQWKTRVIWVPSAVDAVKMIYEETFSDFRDRMDKLYAPVHDLTLIFKAESAGSDPQGATSGLSRAAVKMDEIATMIEQLATATDEALKFAEFFDKIITDIQTLDPLFLPQTRPRVRVEDPDGFHLSRRG